MDIPLSIRETLMDPLYLSIGTKAFRTEPRFTIKI